MATHSGSEGIVKIGENMIAEVKSWSIEESCDHTDASIIGTAWRKYQATIKGWSGSIEAFWDDNDAAGQGRMRIGQTVELNLYPAGVNDNVTYFSGRAIVTGVSKTASFDGLVEVSFTVQGTGELYERQYRINVNVDNSPPTYEVITINRPTIEELSDGKESKTE